jgi:uncharacterized NAD(P)/FAD-binding protein YdhS
MKRITIIGGGAGGTLLAINLIKHSEENPIEINLVEEIAKIGRGAAYSTDEDVHLLNIPAAKMGAFADDVGHFHEWLLENEYDYAPGDFVPRKIYGEYLRDVFSYAIANKSANVSINLLDDEAIDVYAEEDSALVLLESGEVLPSHKVVLAFENFPTDLPTESPEYGEPKSDFNKTEVPLVKCLIEKGEIKPDELARGLAATPQGKVINSKNKVSNVISTLGTALKGILRQSVGIPEIRAQARNLALNLLKDDRKAGEFI